VVDLELGPQHLRPEILKSVTFRTDGTGKPQSNPVNLLLASAFAPSPRRVDVSLFTRNDVTGKWTRSTIYSGPRQKRSDDNYSVRAMCLHRDKVTGVDRLFLTIGSLGIFSGHYDDSAPGKILWSLQSESGPVETRPLAIIEANGDLLFSAGRKIYRRTTGETFYLIGFESWILGHRFPTWGGDENGGFYAGATLAIRDSKGHYRLTEINGRITPSKPVLVAPYCFEVSPFESDHGQVIYSGGLDANKRTATNMAWIFSTHLQDFLRGSP
jgi:hypothetical protein